MFIAYYEINLISWLKASCRNIKISTISGFTFFFKFSVQVVQFHRSEAQNEIDTIDFILPSTSVYPAFHLRSSRNLHTRFISFSRRYSSSSLDPFVRIDGTLNQRRGLSSFLIHRPTSYRHRVEQATFLSPPSTLTETRGRARESLKMKCSNIGIKNLTSSRMFSRTRSI